MRHIVTTALALSLTLAMTPAAFAKSKKMQDTNSEALDEALATAADTNEGTGGVLRMADGGNGVLTDRLFTREEREKIRDYYRNRRTNNVETDNDDNGKGGAKGKSKSKNKSKDKDKGKGKGKSDTMPPGLAKKDELPPGLQKQLEKNGKLPPGLEKRNLPGDLDQNLPRRERRLRRILVDDDVALIDEEQGIVLDILENVVGVN